MRIKKDKIYMNKKSGLLYSIVGTGIKCSTVFDLNDEGKNKKFGTCYMMENKETGDEIIQLRESFYENFELYKKL